MDAESLPLPNSAQEPTFLHYCEIYFCEAWYWRKRDVPMPTCCSTRVLHSRYRRCASSSGSGLRPPATTPPTEPRACGKCGTGTGKLTEVKQLYIQNGRIIEHPKYSLNGNQHK